MRTTLRRMENSLDRLVAAVDGMHRETVSCRRNLMVFRARMDTVECKVLSMQDRLAQTMDLLAEAEAAARQASDIFRATAEGRSAQ